MNRTNTNIKVIGTSLTVWKELANRSSALKVAKVTCVRSYSTTHIYNVRPPSLMSDKEATFPLKEFLLTASYRAPLKQNSPSQRKETNLIRKLGPWHSTIPTPALPASTMSGRKRH
jgi:hypothetical protein